jgi:DNA-binding transcriptional regulator YiaG
MSINAEVFDMTGKELRDLFNASGMTYQDVARRFDVTERTVFVWFSKASVPKMLELAARWVCNNRQEI